MEKTSHELKRTYCKVCMVHCGLVAEVDGETIGKVRGDPAHPLSAGYTCPKGRAIGKIHHAKEAIDQPHMRIDGKLTPVTWDRALDDIATRLRQTIDQYGARSIAINFGSGLGLDSAGYAMEEAMHKALGYGPKFSPLTIDGVAKVLVAGAMGGFPGLNPKTDYDNARMLLYVGTNPMVSHAHNTGMFNPAIWIKAVAKRGQVWTLDPHRTETAALSTGHIAPYPGKDYAVLAWLVRELLEEDSFASKQPVQGLETLKQLLAPYDLDTASAIAGVQPTEMQQLLAAIVTQGSPVVVETGTGITMSSGCNLTQWFSWLLMIVTGAMNTPGGVWFHPGFLTPFDSFELPDMDPWTPGSNTRPEVPGIIGDWPCAVLPDEINNGHIRALFNFGGRLLRSFPDTNALEHALDKLPLHVMLDIAENETSATATHLLPTKDAVERPEFSRWDTLNWNLSLQYSEPLVPAKGQRRSAWWVIAEIMRRAGLPVADHVPLDDQQPGADEAMLKSLMPTARCSFEQLQEQGFIELPMEFPAPWLERHIENIGGWRLVPAKLVDQWQAFYQQDKAFLGEDKALCFSSRRQRKKFNAQLDFLGEEANALIHPSDAAARSINDGDTVKISNKSGAIELIARVDDGMRPGVVSISHGHWQGNVNRLTSKDDIDPISGMALYSGVPIELALA